MLLLPVFSLIIVRRSTRTVEGKEFKILSQDIKIFELCNSLCHPLFDSNQFLTSHSESFTQVLTIYTERVVRRFTVTIRYLLDTDLYVVVSGTTSFDHFDKKIESPFIVMFSSISELYIMTVNEK